jgi:hypothetical protein
VEDFEMHLLINNTEYPLIFSRMPNLLNWVWYAKIPATLNVCHQFHFVGHSRNYMFQDKKDIDVGPFHVEYTN